METRDVGPWNDILVEGPRWLFLALLVYAPLAYGCTEEWAIHLLEAGLGVVIAGWLGASIFLKSRPIVHPICLSCVGLVIVHGWWMTINPHFDYNPESHRFLRITSPVGWLPGTVDQHASVTAMLRITALGAALCFASDLGRISKWRVRIWWTISLTGAGIALLGLLQRVADAPAIYWSSVPATTSFFGTFVYHGNAGSFLNLILPLVAGRTIISISKPTVHGEHALWIASLFLCVAAAFVNVSRAGAAITALLLGAIIFFEGKRLARRIWLPSPSVLLAYAGTVAVVLVGLVLFAGWESPAQKWGLLHSQINDANPRWLALQACWRMLADSGPWGFGPGTFAISFPHYTQSLGDSIAGTWRYAHQDYLQTIIEWGWVGALAPALLFFGGLRRCFVLAPIGKINERENDRLLYRLVGFALAGVALHAIVDFPLQIAALQFYVAVYLGLAWRED